MDQPSSTNIDFESVPIIKGEPVDFDNDDVDDDDATNNLSDEDCEKQRSKSKHSKTNKSPSSSSSSTRSKSTMKKHNKESTTSDSFCALCQKSFATARNLKHHHVSVHLDAPIDCEQCGKTFKNPTLLKVHVRRVHGVDPEAVEARRLKDKLRKQEVRDKARASVGVPPLNTKHQQDEEIDADSDLSNTQVPICRLCNNKSFATTKSLAQHNKAIHHGHTTTSNNDEEDSGEIECESCGKKCKTEGALKKHYLRYHRGGTGADDKYGETEKETPTVIESVKQEIPVTPICDLCDDNKTFATFKSLRQHKKALHKIHDQRNEPEQSKSCGQMCKNQASLRKHQLRQHSTTTTNHKNESSTKSTRRPSGRLDVILNFLKANHEGLTIPSCQLCHKEFATMKILRGHLKLKHTEEPVDCSACGKEFRNSAALKAHARRQHGIKAKELDQVPRSPAEEERLRKQREQKQASRDKRRAEAALTAKTQAPQSSSSVATKRKYIPCVFCKEKFSSRLELKSHELALHSNDTTCGICSKVLLNFIQLKIHISNQHLRPPNPTFCDHCGQSFRSKSTFKAHQLRLHQGQDGGGPVQTYNCTFLGCHMEFKTPYELKHHAKKHEPDDGTRLACDFCDKVFRWKDALNAHVYQRHNAQSELDEPFICPQPGCGKSFKYQQSYAHHLKIHGNGQIWYCQFCESSFTNPISRRRHESGRHPPPPEGYACYECVNDGGGVMTPRFKSPALLERHTSLIHPHLLRNQLEVVRKRTKASENSGPHNSIIPNLIKNNIGSSIMFNEPKISASAFELEFNKFAQSQDVFQQSNLGQYNNYNIYSPNNNTGTAEQGGVAEVDPLSTDGMNNESTMIEQPYSSVVVDDDDWFGGAFDVDVDFDSAQPPSLEFCQVKLDLDRDRGGDVKNNNVAKQSIAAILKKDHHHLQLSSSSSSGIASALLLKRSEIDTTKWSTDPKLVKATPLILCKKYIPIAGREGRSYCEICCVNFMRGPHLAKHMKLFHEIDYHPSKGSSKSRKKTTGVNKKVPKGGGGGWRSTRTKKSESSSEEEEEEVDDQATTEESTTEEEAEEEAGAERDGKKTDSSSSESDEDVIKDKIETLTVHLKEYKLKLRQKKLAKAKSHPRQKRVLVKTSKPQNETEKEGENDDKGIEEEDPSNNKPQEEEKVPKNLLDCKYCSKTFKSTCSLKNHTLIIHEKSTIANSSLSCPKCDKTFDHYRNLQRHIQKVHTVDPSPCELCGKILCNPAKLAEHKQHYHPKSKFQCKLCPARFRVYIGVKQHVRQVHRKKQIMCDQCPYVAPHRQALSTHVKVVHSTCHVVCPTCGKTFKSQMALDIHAKLHNTELDYKCLFCAAKFNTSTKKRRHESVFHGSGPAVRTNREIRDFHCRICNGLFRGSAKLESHVLDVHSQADLDKYYYGPAAAIEAPSNPILDPNDLIISPTATAASSSSSLHIPNLSKAEQKARGAPTSRQYYSKPVPCTICSVLCKNTACRLKHVKLTHPETLIRNCDDCGSEFKTPRQLLRHREVDHGLKTGRAATVTCPVCRLVFPKRGYMLHYDSHGVPAICDLCGKEYKNRDGLRDHVRTVHEGRKRPSVLQKQKARGVVKRQRLIVTPDMQTPARRQHQPHLQHGFNYY